MLRNSRCQLCTCHESSCRTALLSPLDGGSSVSLAIWYLRRLLSFSCFCLCIFSRNGTAENAGKSVTWNWNFISCAAVNQGFIYIVWCYLGDERSLLVWFRQKDCCMNSILEEYNGNGIIVFLNLSYNIFYKYKEHDFYTFKYYILRAWMLAEQSRNNHFIDLYE